MHLLLLLLLVIAGTALAIALINLIKQLWKLLFAVIIILYTPIARGYTIAINMLVLFAVGSTAILS
jgi:hypothetical protein